MHSEQTDILTAAIAKAQAVMKPAPFNKVNPHFKNKYADLSSVIETVVKPLTDQGIAVTQTTEIRDGGFILVTTLHLGGQWIASEYPLPNVSKPQELGSALTYAKRYSLAAIACVASDEDDDAEGARKDGQTATTPKASPIAPQTVAAPVHPTTGEVGPHNGGTTPNPDCSGTKVCGRFGSALWYADAMSAKARAGYAAFCRQDFVGADYGLVNYTTLAPTPDYWLLALWKRLVGVRVLAVSPPADTRVRAYAFCGTTASTVTLVFINLASTPACLTPPGIANPVKPRTEWNLTPDDGVSVTAAGVRLNGVLLALGAGGALPPLTGQSVPATVDIQLPPVSVTLISFPTIADACGGR